MRHGCVLVAALPEPLRTRPVPPASPRNTCSLHTGYRRSLVGPRHLSLVGRTHWPAPLPPLGRSSGATTANHHSSGGDQEKLQSTPRAASPASAHTHTPTTPPPCTYPPVHAPILLSTPPLTHTPPPLSRLGWGGIVAILGPTEPSLSLLFLFLYLPPQRVHTPLPPNPIFLPSSTASPLLNQPKLGLRHRQLAGLEPRASIHRSAPDQTRTEDAAPSSSLSPRRPLLPTPSSPPSPNPPLAHESSTALSCRPCLRPEEPNSRLGPPARLRSP